MTARKPDSPNPLRDLLEAQRDVLRRRQQSIKSANKLTDKQNRWQRFNRFVWDKRQG